MSEREVYGSSPGAAALGVPPGRRFMLAVGECRYCDENRSRDMMPPHDASERCESGKRDHCTCDTCF